MIIDYCQECGCSACLCGGPAMGIVPSWQDVADRWMKACIEHESTIADLRERHGAFVRAAKDDAIAAEGYLSLDGRMRNWAAFMAAQRIIALCDAELAKEKNNG